MQYIPTKHLHTRKNTRRYIYDMNSAFVQYDHVTQQLHQYACKRRQAVAVLLQCAARCQQQDMECNVPPNII